MFNELNIQDSTAKRRASTRNLMYRTAREQFKLQWYSPTIMNRILAVKMKMFIFTYSMLSFLMFKFQCYKPNFYEISCFAELKAIYKRIVFLSILNPIFLFIVFLWFIKFILLPFMSVFVSSSKFYSFILLTC